MRQRLAAAHAADVSDWSGAVVEEWNERAEDDLLERGRAYLVGDLSALNEEQVAGRLDEQLRLVEEGLTWHFRLHAAGVDAIGRLGLELTRDHGWRVAELMDLFTGLSATTTGPAAAQEELAALVRDEGAAEALLAATTLADVARALPDHRRRRSRGTRTSGGSGPCATRSPARRSSSARTGCCTSCRRPCARPRARPTSPPRTRPPGCGPRPA